ncbi:MAG TPA: AMP-binding protein [Gemmatimonadales bacterium]|nr:AMP-binding protein [Gemmatimonadales bacterium]
MIRGLLEMQAARSPDAIAVTAPGRTGLTYARLRAQVEIAGGELTRLGAGRGDRVAIVLPNGPEMAVMFLAVASVATAAPLNPTYRAEEFGFYLSDLGAKMLVVAQGSDVPAVAVAHTLGIPVLELSASTQAEAGVFTLAAGQEPAAARPPGLTEANDIALVLHTSGTTSRPKLVPLTQKNLCQSAEHIRAALDLTTRDRCLNVMPLFHIHGLVAAVLASLAAGGTVICTPGFYASHFFDWIEECRPTWYTGVPTMHQSILAQAPARRGVIQRHPLRFIRSSSSALPPQIMNQLEATFGAPVIEAYGMTEAAHQVASNPLPPRPRKPGSVGIPAGPEVAVMDAAGTLSPPGIQGEVVIRGPNVMPGYDHNPEANRAAFTDGWFRTGDLGSLDGDGYLRLTGRIKEVINRGGEKISPREVDEVLMDHPAVAQVLTFAIPDGRLGEEIGAVVVLHPGAATTERELRDFAAGKLADFKVPRTVVFLDEIPKGATGKLQRIGLAERLGLVPGPSAEAAAARAYTAPRTPVERLVAQLWGNVLKVERVGVDQPFLELGGDSMLATLLVSRIRQEVGVEVSVRSLLEAPTVAEQARVIVDLLLQASGTSLISARQTGAHP